MSKPASAAVAAHLVVGRARFEAAWATFEATKDAMAQDASKAGRWIVFDGTIIRQVCETKQAGHRWGMEHMGPTSGFIVALVPGQRTA